MLFVLDRHSEFRCLNDSEKSQTEPNEWRVNGSGGANVRWISNRKLCNGYKPGKSPGDIFSSLQQSSLGECVPMMASDSCFGLTGEEPSEVFCCCSVSILKFFSAHHGCSPL